MASLKITVTHRKRKDYASEAYAKTVIIQDTAIADVIPNGTGTQIILLDGTEYLSAQTVNAVGAALSDTALT